MSSGSAAPENRDSQIAELVGLTGLAPAEAEQYLTAANGDLQTAAAFYFDGSGPSAQEQEQPDDDDDIAMAGDDQPTNPNPNPNPNANAAAPPPGAGFGRTLDGAYVPTSSSSAAGSSSSAQASSSRRQPAQRGLRTLGDLQNQSQAGHAGHGHAHNDDDDDDDYQDEKQDFFAGGEKSGLAVQNPSQDEARRHINSILKRARQGAARPGGDDERPAAPSFRGTGMTLGGDDTPSRAIPDPNAEAAPPAVRVRRQLHLWRDGFSVDDGDLYNYNDPANARTLEMIRSGHAPLHILNVEHGQEVDVEVHQHPEEDYTKPKKKYVPFSGSGQRLGSPTPGATSTPAPSAAPAASSSATAAPPAVEVDAAAPTVNLQIRLGDGTRLQSRFNTTHTIGDVYNFVNAASPASTQREYALMTTFPSKELNDEAQVLGDLSEFKRGGVVVQKWK